MLYKYGDVYNISEYEFAELDNFSSIQLKSNHLFTIGSFTFTPSTVIELVEQGPIELTSESAPFPQADDVSKYEQILELMAEGPVSKQSLADHFEFDERQSDYYSNALRFLGLAVRTNPGEINLSSIGSDYIKAEGRERKEILIRQMSQLESFRWLVKMDDFDSRNFDRSKLFPIMERDFEHIFEADASESVIRRRASTIVSWVSWVHSIGG